MNNKKTVLTKISILTAVLFLNTGYVFGLFGDKPQVQPTQSNKKIVPPKKVTQIMPTSSVQAPSLMQVAPECTDDLNSPCNKGLIETKALKPKQVVTKIGGEVHILRSIQGQKITIVERPTGYVFPEFRNKIVILEMFGKNCSHCIKEMPIMNRLRRQYRNNLEIVALQVEGQMSPLQANALIRRHKIGYPVISGETATNLQYHVQNTFGWTGILPFIMVIKNGVTEFTYRGSVTYNEINNDIRSILN
jgi:thiol-disulfide isomerase/thioredoxin